MRRTLVTAALVAAALVMTVASSASARALHWSGPIHVGHNGIDAVACPSTSLCVAGSADGLLVSTDPSGPASSWQLVFTPPTAGNAAPQVTSVSCSTTSFCAAATLAGDVLTSSDPSGGKSAWQLTKLGLPVGQFPNINVPQISCASPSQCVTIAAGAKSVFSASDPTGGADKWTETQLGDGLETVACTPPRLCVLGDDRGDVRTSTDPGKGARSWTFAHIFGKPGYTEDLHGAVCGSPHWCLVSAISFTEDVLLLATKPTVTTPRTHGAWQNQVAFSSAGFNSGSCVGTFCAYTGTNDGAVYYPTGSFRTLTHTPVFRPQGGRNQGVISCASRHWCLIGTTGGDVYVGRR